MKVFWAAGCALKAYKPEAVEKMACFLKERGLIEDTYEICCKATQDAQTPVRIINTCAGCDRRFRTLYKNVTTVSLWEVLLETDFPFPDYHGMEMSVHDACPTHNQPQVHEAVRKLLERMNIRVVDAELSGSKARCCGSVYFDAGYDSGYVVSKCRERVADFPCRDVVVYCVGCARFLNLGGARAHHLIDLLYNEPTTVEAKQL